MRRVSPLSLVLVSGIGTGLERRCGGRPLAGVAENRKKPWKYAYTTISAEA